MGRQQPLEWRIHDDVLIILVLESCVVFPREVEPVNEAISQLIGERALHHVVIDLERVRYLSSSALGMLVKVHKCVAASGKKLRICGLNEGLRDNFAITQLDKLLDIRTNKNEAIAELAKADATIETKH